MHHRAAGSRLRPPALLPLQTSGKIGPGRSVSRFGRRPRSSSIAHTMSPDSLLLLCANKMQTSLSRCLGGFIRVPISRFQKKKKHKHEFRRGEKTRGRERSKAFVETMRTESSLKVYSTASDGEFLFCLRVCVCETLFDTTLRP